MLKPNIHLDSLAKRYVWWESADWSYQHPVVFLSQVMNFGYWEDIQLLRSFFTDDVLRDVLRSAPPGIFNYRAWDYWHLKLGIAPIPDLPTREL
jgi:hypothetical protein